MEVNEAKRLRELEEENRRLKTMVADLSLDKEALKAVDPKKRVELVSAQAGRGVRDDRYRYSERHACKLLDLDRSKLSIQGQTGPQQDFGSNW